MKGQKGQDSNKIGSSVLQAGALADKTALVPKSPNSKQIFLEKPCPKYPETLNSKLRHKLPRSLSAFPTFSFENLPSLYRFARRPYMAVGLGRIRYGYAESHPLHPLRWLPSRRKRHRGQ